MTKNDEERASTDFNYLLNMSFSSLTSEKVDDLHCTAEINQQKLQQLQKTTAEDLWISDLDKLEENLK